MNNDIINLQHIYYVFCWVFFFTWTLQDWVFKSSNRVVSAQRMLPLSIPTWRERYCQTLVLIKINPCSCPCVLLTLTPVLRFHSLRADADNSQRERVCVCVLRLNSQCIVRDYFLGKELLYSFIHSAHLLSGLIFYLWNWLLQHKNSATHLFTVCTYICLPSKEEYIFRSLVNQKHEWKSGWPQLFCKFCSCETVK